MKEIELQRLAVDYLRKKGYLVWRVYGGPVLYGGSNKRRPNPNKGQPDIMGVTPDKRPFAVEFKSKNGKLSADQIAWLEKLSQYGYICLVADTLEQVQEEFC